MQKYMSWDLGAQWSAGRPALSEDSVLPPNLHPFLSRMSTPLYRSAAQTRGDMTDDGHPGEGDVSLYSMIFATFHHFEILQLRSWANSKILTFMYLGMSHFFLTISPIDECGEIFKIV